MEFQDDLFRFQKIYSVIIWTDLNSTVGQPSVLAENEEDAIRVVREAFDLPENPALRAKANMTGEVLRRKF